MSATAPSPRRPTPRPTARPELAPRPGIRAVPAPGPRAPRAPFVAVVLILLIAGLGGLLLLNTLLAQGSFTVQRLSLQVTALQDREQALQQRAATLDSPRRLARQAAALGMVPVVNPAFLRVSDGRVLGVPKVAVSPPPPPTPTPSPRVSTPTSPNDSAVVVEDGSTGKGATGGDKGH